MPISVLAFNTIGEVESFVVNFHAQMHGPTRGHCNRGCEGIGLCGIWQAGHDAQMFAMAFVVSQVEIVELAAVVVTNEPCHLLIVFRFKLHDCLSSDTMRLLTPGHEGLSKRAADRVAAKEAKVSRAFNQAEDLTGPRRAQPLKLHGQLLRVEVFTNRRRRKTLLR